MNTRAFCAPISFLSACLIMSATPLISVANEAVVTDLKTCSSIQSDSKRLVCFDNLSAKMFSTLESAPPKSNPTLEATAPLIVASTVSKTAKAAKTAKTTLPDKTPLKKEAPVTQEKVIPPDDLGAERLNVGKKKEEPDSVLVRVIECKRTGGNKKYQFTLEGGQVWKQISDKRLSFTNCDFIASINKDFFGYKMQIEETGRKFRVARVR